MLDNRALCSTIRSDGDVIIRIEPSPELDLATSQVLDSVLSGLFDDPCRRVVVDLAGVEFIDSTGLRVLLLAQTALEGHGIALVLRDPRPQARRLFDVAGVLDMTSTCAWCTSEARGSQDCS